MTKHTAGPWRASIDPKTGAFTIEDDNRIAVLCSRAPWPHRAEESAANARLIAAAPDLLAFAKELLRHDGGDGSQDYHAIKLYDAREKLRSAIATAEGKP